MSAYFELPPRELFWHSVIHRREYTPFAERIQSSDAVRRTCYGWAALEYRQRCYITSYIATERAANLYDTILKITAQPVAIGHPVGYAQWIGSRSELRVLAATERDPYTPTVPLCPTRFAATQLRQLYQDLVVYLGPEPPPVMESPPSIITRRVPRVRPRS